MGKCDDSAQVWRFFCGIYLMFFQFKTSDVVVDDLLDVAVFLIRVFGIKLIFY